MIRGLLFNGDVFVPFDLLLHGYHFDPLFRNDFLMILYSLFDGVVVCLGDFVRNRLDDPPLLVLDNFLLDRHSFNPLPVLVLDDLLLVRYVVYPALPYLTVTIPFTTYWLVTCEDTKLLASERVRVSSPTFEPPPDTAPPLGL